MIGLCSHGALIPLEAPVTGTESIRRIPTSNWLVHCPFRNWYNKRLLTISFMLR